MLLDRELAAGEGEVDLRGLSLLGGGRSAIAEHAGFAKLGPSLGSLRLESDESMKYWA